jgi:hypothetical protein
MEAINPQSDHLKKNYLDKIFRIRNIIVNLQLRHIKKKEGVNQIENVTIQKKGVIELKGLFGGFLHLPL